LAALELDEALDLALGRGAQGAVLLDHGRTAVAVVEELADAEVERSQDFEQRVETDFVLSLLHAGEVGLVNADFLGELHLVQLALAAELPDLAADELELCGPVHHAGKRTFVDNYATTK